MPTQQPNQYITPITSGGVPSAPMTGGGGYWNAGTSVDNSFQVGSTSGTQQAVGTQAQQNTYTPQQQALQGQALGFIGSTLSGGSVPQNFGLPQVTYDAAMTNFDKYQAPGLAAQYGAGSPTINAARESLQLQLAGMAGQNAMSNAINAYNSAAQYAFTPIGQTASDAKVQSSQETSVQNALANKNWFQYGQSSGGGTGSSGGGFLGGQYNQLIF